MTLGDKIRAKYMTEKDNYTDDEINELALWLQSLTLGEVFLLQDIYFRSQEAQLFTRDGHYVLH